MNMTKILLTGLLLLLMTVAVGIGLAWAPDRSVDTLKTRWAAAPSRFIELQGMQVHLRDEGPRDDPEPIVLMHGTSASLHPVPSGSRHQGQVRSGRIRAGPCG